MCIYMCIYIYVRTYKPSKEVQSRLLLFVRIVRRLRRLQDPEPVMGVGGFQGKHSGPKHRIWK